MAFIDGTAVNVALPQLQTSLKATILHLQWVVEAYALLLAAFLLAGGSLGDRYDRRVVFVIGVALFCLASVWCGLSPGIGQLITARAFQGLGGALLVPNSLAMISVAYPPESRGRAIGTWSGVTAIMAAIGPVLGGWMVQHISWRWVFFINVPIGVAIAVLTAWRIPACGAKAAPGALDWPAALLAATGLGGIVYAFIESRPWAGATGAVFLLVFILVEARTAAPLLPLELFRSRDFTGANLITLFLYAALSGALFFLPLQLIQIQGYAPTAAGSALLPFVLLMFLLSRWSGGLVERYGARLPLVIGPLITAAGYALLTRPAVGRSFWTTVLPAVATLGLGMAVSVAPLTTAVMTAAPAKYAGVASGVNNAVSRVGGLLAIAVLGLVLRGEFERTLDRQYEKLNLPAQIRREIDGQRELLAAAQTNNGLGRLAIHESFLAGYRSVLWLSASLAALSSVCAAVSISGRRAVSARGTPAYGHDD